MEDITEDEIQTTKEALGVEDPTNEQIESVTDFFPAKQVRLSDDQKDELTEQLRKYVNRYQQNGRISPDNQTLEVEYGEVEMKIEEILPEIIHIIVHDHNEVGGFNFIESDIEHIAVFELQEQFAYSKTTKSDAKQIHQIDLSVEFP